MTINKLLAGSALVALFSLTALQPAAACNAQCQASERAMDNTSSGYTSKNSSKNSGSKDSGSSSKFSKTSDKKLKELVNKGVVAALGGGKTPKKDWKNANEAQAELDYRAAVREENKRLAKKYGGRGDNSGDKGGTGRVSAGDQAMGKHAQGGGYMK